MAKEPINWRDPQFMEKLNAHINETGINPFTGQPATDHEKFVAKHYGWVKSSSTMATSVIGTFIDFKTGGFTSNPYLESKLAKIDDLDFAYNSGKLSGTDKVKLSSWDYPPNTDLYIKYKSVYDNPKYYNQSTGEIHWPDGDGFVSVPEEIVLRPGTRIDRLGSDYGTYTSPEGTPYEQRAVAPGTDSRPYSIFEVIEPLTVKGGEIAPWFDEPGGGIQYLLPDTVDELLDKQILRRVKP